MNEGYSSSVRLLLSVMPDVFQAPLFALKGGTAINLFIRNLPRLSVDLDLVLIDHTAGRDDALSAISDGLRSIQTRLEATGFRCEMGATSGGDEVKLFIQRDRTRIKVEVNYVFRGTVLPVANRRLVKSVQDTFYTDFEAPVLHPDELYGSKLAAAMDRQHPRDLFDVLDLYAKDGLTSGIVECFVCYLAGHNRPVHEVLFANEINITSAFDTEFLGMTKDPVSLDELLDVRRRLFSELPSALTDSHRKFLCGLVKGEPDWSLMSCGHLGDMPAIKWKLRNLSHLRETNKEKFAFQFEKLEEKFAALST